MIDFQIFILGVINIIFLKYGLVISLWDSVQGLLIQWDENVYGLFWNFDLVIFLQCDFGEFIVFFYVFVFFLVKCNNNIYCRELEKVNEWEIYIYIKFYKIQIIYENKKFFKFGF